MIAEEAQSSDLADYDAIIKPVDREHWSYQPIRRPAIPKVKQAGWVRNSIDAFILANLEEQGWRPATAVSRRQFLRRVYLDVVGLPPTVAEQNAFLKDDSSTANEKVVDALLKQPGYGERWARHWLDVVRYAETNGYERDAIKPSVWRYRDYVIDAFNKDKPYDRFVLEQLAGDELPDSTGESLIATGFYRLGPWDDEPADPAQDRFDQLDDLIRTSSEVFLGMTLGCARCHNHKFDAVTMHDYYRLATIFNGLKRPQAGRRELDRPAGSREQIAALETRDQKINGLNEKIAATRVLLRVDHIKSGNSKLPSEVQQAFRVESEKQTAEQKTLVERNREAIDKEIAAVASYPRQQVITDWEGQIAKLKDQTPDLPRGYFMEELSADVPNMHLLLRGRASNPGPVVSPGFPTVLSPVQPKFESSDDRTSQRRLTFARWVISPENPLTARVIVNRVWMYHFGQALVRTPNDFGVLGEFSTHPELLDWLAHWFVHDANWSLKKLHRLILTSHTYQMNKSWNEVSGKEDPTNRHFWRFPYSRLTAETIRDSMLAVSGKLNRKMYGPSTYLYVPKEALDGHSDPGKIWKAFDEEEASRRTIYAFIKRSMVVPMLEVLDLCDSTRSNEKRNVTSVPTQALMLFNGHFVNNQAEYFAKRLEKDAGSDVVKQIELAWRLAFCREPEEREILVMQNYQAIEKIAVKKESGSDGKLFSEAEAEHRALVQMCRVIFNMNEFVYPN